MGWSSFVVAALVLAFLIFITGRNEVGPYLNVLGI